MSWPHEKAPAGCEAARGGAAAVTPAARESTGPTHATSATGERIEVGGILWQAGHQYQLRAIVPNVRRDGVATWRAVWVATCATCGRPFYTVTGCEVPRYLMRRCKPHRRARVPAQPWSGP